MKRLLLYLSTYILFHISFSQSYDPEKVDKKARTLYNQAMERAQDGNLTHAAGLLLQCIEIDTKYVEAYLSLAGVYGQLKNYKSSIEYYEKSFALDSDYRRRRRHGGVAGARRGPKRS